MLTSTGPVFGPGPVIWFWGIWYLVQENIVKAVRVIMIMGVHILNIVFMCFAFILGNGPPGRIVLADTAYSAYFKFV